MQCNIKPINGRLAAALESPYPRPTTRCPPIYMERCLGLRRCSSGIHVIGDYVMDSNNRIGRRERFEILKIVQGLGEGVVAVDKGQLRPLRPSTILAALEESIARRNREGRMWPAFLDLFWIAGSTIRRQALTKDEARQIAANVAKLLEPVAQNRLPTAQS